MEIKNGRKGIKRGKERRKGEGKERHGTKEWNGSEGGEESRGIPDFKSFSRIS